MNSIASIEKSLRKNKKTKCLFTPRNLSIYKNERKLGKTIENALLAAGHTPKTARHRNSRTKLATIGEMELNLSLTKKEYSIDVLIERLEYGLRWARETGDLTNYNRTVELIGRYLAAWKQVSHVDTTTTVQIADADRRVLGRYLTPPDVPPTPDVLTTVDKTGS